jgi:NhaP-type Na+/H+ or K+/H+ antiporter
VALAAACFAVAQTLGGSGFIACFAGGPLFGRMARGDRHTMLQGAEATGEALALLTWLIFGWFGPRGLASIVFAIMVNDAGLPGNTTLMVTVGCAVVLSVVAHGISANPLIRALFAAAGAAVPGDTSPVTRHLPARQEQRGCNKLFIRAVAETFSHSASNWTPYRTPRRGATPMNSGCCAGEAIRIAAEYT